MDQQQHNIKSVINTLRSNPDLPVIFTLNEDAISPGYHITEVKHCVINSLDCGQGIDQWHEIVVQLLDGTVDTANTYMQSTKLIGILDKALNGEHSNESAELYFEFTPSNAALQKSNVSTVEILNNTIVIALTASKAQCKPYQRALASGKVSVSDKGCCGSVLTSSNACCDNGSSRRLSDAN